jgi:2-polyprenyl-6-methoxyphenol hydroxylase-like FAD-dependent oxidoreductase
MTNAVSSATSNDESRDALDTEVLIVGAGPTGLALACQLARFGVDFLVVDRNDGVTPYSKAIGVHARTLEIYEQLDLASRAVADGAITKRAKMIVGGHVRGELELSDIGAGFSPYPYVLMLEQSKNEQLLYEYLQSRGHDVEWGTGFESLEQHGRGVTANVRTKEGGARRVSARYLVGCDGARSPVRHALDLQFAGSTFERTFYVADTRVDGDLDHDSLQACLGKDSFVIFFPLKGERRFRIVGVFPEQFAGQPESIVYEEIERYIKEQSKLALDIHDVEWFSTYKVHTRHVSSFSQGRCFLAGDAAHIHSPAGAQGMNTGIQDAYNLAWKLALVLQGKVPSSLLDSYNEERLENAKNLLETTDRMFEIVASSNPVFSFLRLNVVPPIAGRLMRMHSVTSFIFPILSQIGINYRHGALSDHSDDGDFDVRAGDRMPWFQLRGASIYDRLRAPCFHWLRFTDELPDEESRAPADIPHDVHLLPLRPEVIEAFGTRTPFAVLLRPDNYIAFVSNDLSVERMRRYFAETLGRAV